MAAFLAVVVVAGCSVATLGAAQAAVRPKAAMCATLWNRAASLPVKTAVLRAHVTRAVISGNVVVGGSLCSVSFERTNGLRLVSTTPCGPGTTVIWSVPRATNNAILVTARNSAVGRVTRAGRIVLG